MHTKQLILCQLNYILIWFTSFYKLKINHSFIVKPQKLIQHKNVQKIYLKSSAQRKHYYFIVNVNGILKICFVVIEDMKFDHLYSRLSITNSKITFNCFFNYFLLINIIITCN